MSCNGNVRKYFDVKNRAFLWNFMRDLTFSVRNVHILTIHRRVDAKIAHLAYTLCVFFQSNVLNRTSRGPNPITHGILIARTPE